MYRKITSYSQQHLLKILPLQILKLRTEKIYEAARLAHIHDDILGFTEGYGTIVGERGVSLSGGQKQRVSIARALIMEPELLILDDSLSAVDAKTEEAILESLKQTRTGETTIITSHRLSAIQHAHKIIVMHEGTIVEAGTHEELLEMDGRYKEMYDLQQLRSACRTRRRGIMSVEKQPKLTAKDQWIVFKRLLRYTIPHKKSVIIALVLLILTVTGSIVGPLIIQRFIDNHLTTMNFPRSDIMNIAIVYIGIQIFMVIVSYFQLIRFQDIALKIIQQMRIDVFSKVQGLGMRYFDKTPAGSIVSRVTNDTEAIKEMFVSVIVTFLQAIFVLIGVYIALFSLDAKLAFISLLLLPLFLAVIVIYRRYSADFYQDIRERLSQLNAKIAESLSGMGMIQAFRQEDRLEAEFDDINEKHFRAGMRNIKFDGILLGPAIDLLYAGAIVFVLGYFGFLSLDSPVEVGILYAFTTLIGRLFQPVQQVMQRLSIFQQAMVAASRVFKLMDDPDMEPEQQDSKKC